MTNSVLWVDLTQTSFESQELSLINYVVSCLLHVVKSFHRLLFNEEPSYQQGRGGVILCRPPGNINSKSNVNGKTAMVQFGANCKVSLTVACVTKTWQVTSVTSVTKTWQMLQVLQVLQKPGKRVNCQSQVDGDHVRKEDPIRKLPSICITLCIICILHKYKYNYNYYMYYRPSLPQ